MHPLRLRIVTPVYATRAQPDRAELSVPTLRGLLRYWFRFGMGSIVGNDLAALHKLEAAAFGATEIASPFQLRVQGPVGGFRVQTVGTHKELEPGYSYLAFSLYERQPARLGGGFLSSRTCILPDQTFTLTFGLRRPDPLLEQVLLGSLWLLTHLGGIGCRSRRGFGVVTVDNGNEVAGFPFRSIVEPQQHYQEGFSIVKDTFAEFAMRNNVSLKQSMQDGTAQFTSLAELWLRLIQVYSQKDVTPWFDYWGVVLRGFRNEAYNDERMDHRPPSALKNFLRRTTEDYQQVASYFMDDPEQVKHDGSEYLFNDVLGLPLIIRSTSRNKQTAVKWISSSETQDDRKVHDRRASPLILRPVPLQSDALLTLIAFLPAQPLPASVSSEPT